MRRHTDERGGSVNSGASTRTRTHTHSLILSNIHMLLHSLPHTHIYLCVVRAIPSRFIATEAAYPARAHTRRSVDAHIYSSLIRAHISYTSDDNLTCTSHLRIDSGACTGPLVHSTRCARHDDARGEVIETCDDHSVCVRMGGCTFEGDRKINSAPMYYSHVSCVAAGDFISVCVWTSCACADHSHSVSMPRNAATDCTLLRISSSRAT
jgi:hypothetical protein